jgi:hypothetical protein
MPGVTRAGITSIFLHMHRALIILIIDVFTQRIALGLHRILHPHVIWEIITRTDNFSFGGALGVQFSFACFTMYNTGAKRHGTTSVTTHIVVYRVTRVHPCQ